MVSESATNCFEGLELWKVKGGGGKEIQSLESLRLGVLCDYPLQRNNIAVKFLFVIATSGGR